MCPLPAHKRPKCEGNVKLYYFFAELREQTMKINTNNKGNSNNNSHQHSVVGKVQESVVCKCEIQIKDCETANGLCVCWSQTFEVFRNIFPFVSSLAEQRVCVEKERLLQLVKEREKIKKETRESEEKCGHGDHQVCV